MKALRYWQLRDDACELYRLHAETSANAPRFSYPYDAMNFMAALAIRILIANSCTRWRWIFKGLSQDGGWTDFAENLCASLF